MCLGEGRAAYLKRREHPDRGIRLVLDRARDVVPAEVVPEKPHLVRAGGLDLEVSGGKTEGWELAEQPEGRLRAAALRVLPLRIEPLHMVEPEDGVVLVDHCAKLVLGKRGGVTHNGTRLEPLAEVLLVAH